MRGDSGGPLFDLDGNLIGIHIRIGRHLAGNLHAPASAIQTGWPRLAKGDVWGGTSTGKGLRGAKGAKGPKGPKGQGPKGPKGPKGRGT